MEIVKILRQLWKLRLLVVCVALLSIVAGVLVSFRITSPTKLESRKYTVGTAATRILVDTPASQVVDVAPKGSDAVGARATLLANLMVDGDIKLAIARKAGLEPRELQGMSDSAIGGAVPAESPSPRGYILSTKVLETASGTSLPIIEVATQGPDAVSAQRLANAAVDGLREYLDTKAATERVPGAQRLKVSGLDRAEGRQVTRGPRNLFSVAASIFFFVAGCAFLLASRWLISELRSPEPKPDKPPGAGDAQQGLRAVAQPDSVVQLPAVARMRQPGEPVPKNEPPRTPVREAAGNWWGRGPE